MINRKAKLMQDFLDPKWTTWPIVLMLIILGPWGVLSEVMLRSKRHTIPRNMHLKQSRGFKYNILQNNPAKIRYGIFVAADHVGIQSYVKRVSLLAMSESWTKNSIKWVGLTLILSIKIVTYTTALVPPLDKVSNWRWWIIGLEQLKNHWLVSYILKILLNVT